MSQAAGALGASLAAGIGIDSELESKRMNVVHQSLDPAGKAFGVGNDVSTRIPFHLPAVVNHYVLISGVFDSRLDHGIGHLPDHVFTYIAAEFVPAIPTHGRRARQSLVLRG